MALPVWGVAEEASTAIELAVQDSAHSAWSNGLESTIFDYFTGTDSGTLGSNWSQGPGWKISSNTARNDWGNGSIAWRRMGYAGESDNYSRIQLNRLVNDVGPVCRGNGSLGSIYGYYLHRKAQDQFAISKIINNVATEIASGTVTEFAGMSLYITAVGSLITASVDSLEFSVVDTSITSGGYVGIITYR